MTREAYRDNIVIITGAASGIGAALAHEAAAQGAKLALAGLDAAGLESVAEACRASGGPALTVPTDVTTEDACRALVERTVDEYGGIDTLVNNAGIAMFSMVEDMEGVGIVERLMQVNFSGSVNCTYHALPHLKKSRGRIVVVSSLAGKVGMPGSSAYAASKHALSGFFDSLRIELMDTGVTVSMVFPDFVATNLRHNMLGPDGKPMRKKTRLNSKMMTPDECASHILAAGARRRRETAFSLRGRLSPVLKLFPGVVDRMARNAVSKTGKRLPEDLQTEALSLPLRDGSGSLHVQRIHQTGREDAPAVLMLHGTLENGRIFYSSSLKGLAPLIARSGFDVYVPDYRGRGKSEPPIRRGTPHGQTEVVTGDIPDCLTWLKKERRVTSVQVVAHSWGGVMMSAALARFPEHLAFVGGLYIKVPTIVLGSPLVSALYCIYESASTGQILPRGHES